MCRLMLFYSVILKQSFSKTIIIKGIPALTLGDDPLEVDDVGMLELAHDAGLAQEVPPLLLGVTGFQSFNGYWDLSLPWQPQQTTAHLTELTCNREQSISGPRQQRARQWNASLCSGRFPSRSHKEQSYWGMNSLPSEWIKSGSECLYL